MSDHGLFGPESVTWRVNRESVLLLGGGRALLLQVAHPSVAAGVAQHSGYREDPWGRLSRTLDVTRRIVFGDTATALEASAHLGRVHAHVAGTVEQGARAGEAYEASDPELLRWVWATLVESALLIYTRYVGPLKVSDVEDFYAEQKRFLEACGAPAASAPATFAQFMQWYDETVEQVLEVTPAAREVCDAILRPRRLPVPLRPAFDALNLATVGLLPPTLREDYGLSWGPQRERLLAAQRGLLRRAMPLLPSLVRELPAARSAHRRLREAA
ncbi:MAG TPA: oxygenase MpaB family protein [Conexibacter sp.]|nr:oxygenase MpaB family protein [Conexibacter sp.]